MKRLLYLLPVLGLLMCACLKEQDKEPEIVCPENSVWTGSWEFDAYWASPGAGPVSWSPATEKATIHFEPGLLFNTTRGNQDRYLTAMRGTDVMLKLYKEGNTDTSLFIMEINRDTLYLYNPACIEGCAERYVRTAKMIIN